MFFSFFSNIPEDETETNITRKLKCSVYYFTIHEVQIISFTLTYGSRATMSDSLAQGHCDVLTQVMVMIELPTTRRRMDKELFKISPLCLRHVRMNK